MPDFSIHIDLGELLPEGSALTSAEFPTLSSAVHRLAEAAHADWVAYASGAPLPSGKVIQNRTGEYARSILVRSNGDFSAEVYSDLAYAQAIEEGMPARDLKKILSSSLKVRISAAGKRYLIIPFRHNSPNSVLGNNMPTAVANWWKDEERKPSSITGTFNRPSGTGAVAWRSGTDMFGKSQKKGDRLTVPGRTYSWGTRLGKADFASLGIAGASAKRLDGMVNFRKPGGTGGGAHSQFITFRVMTEDSKGWIAPAQAGKWPAKTVSDTLQPIAEQAFAKAVQEDIKRIIGGE